MKDVGLIFKFELEEKLAVTLGVLNCDKLIATVCKSGSLKAGIGKSLIEFIGTTMSANEVVPSVK